MNLTRWVAAELVVLSHVRGLVFVPWHDVPVSDRNPWLWSLFAITSLGHQAVIVFFVLSGFLVGGSVVADLRKDRFSLPRYLVNRISRLYVVLIPGLILGWALDRTGIRAFSATGVYFWRWPHEMLSLQYDVSSRMGLGTALANAVNLQTIVAPTLGSNGPLWSLANEFWYYLLFPALLLPFLFHRFWPRAGCALAAVAIAWLTYPGILLYGSIWLLGVAIRMVPPLPVPRPWMTAPVVFAVGALGSRMAAADSSSRTSFLWDFALGLVFCLFLLGGLHERRNDAPIGERIHEHLAGFSYSLYLLHFPFVLLTCVWLQSNWELGLAQQPASAKPFLIMTAIAVMANAYAWLVSLGTERHTGTVRRLLLARSPAPGAEIKA